MDDILVEGVRLTPATIQLLEIEERSGADLAHVLGAAAPPSWPPEFNGPETRAWIRDRLLSDSDGVGWYSWYVMAARDGMPILAGVAGFKGAPDQAGQVEIGYSVVPELHRLGIATAAVTGLCRFAFKHGARAVVAHTLPNLIASQAVLSRTGFQKVAVLEDPHEGTVWRYVLNRG